MACRKFSWSLRTFQFRDSDTTILFYILLPVIIFIDKIYKKYDKWRRPRLIIIYKYMARQVITVGISSVLTVRLFLNNVENIPKEKFEWYRYQVYASSKVWPPDPYAPTKSKLTSPNWVQFFLTRTDPTQFNHILWKKSKEKRAHNIRVVLG